MAFGVMGPEICRYGEASHQMYGIRFVGDDELPEGHDFVFAHAGESAMIFYRESAVSPESLEDSWAAYRATLGRQPRDPSELREVVERAIHLAHSA